jgi:hypothetical protein
LPQAGFNSPKVVLQKKIAHKTKKEKRLQCLAACGRLKP